MAYMLTNQKVEIWMKFSGVLIVTKVVSSSQNLFNEENIFLFKICFINLFQPFFQNLFLNLLEKFFLIVSFTQSLNKLKTSIWNLDHCVEACSYLSFVVLDFSMQDLLSHGIAPIKNKNIMMYIFNCFLIYSYD